jgi:hypothetical protein
MSDRSFSESIPWEMQIGIWGYAIIGDVLEPDALRCEKPIGEPWDHDGSWLRTWRDENDNYAPERWALSNLETEARRRFLTRRVQLV